MSGFFGIIPTIGREKPEKGTIQDRPSFRGERVTAHKTFDELIERYSGVFGAAVQRVCLGTNRQLIPDVEQEIRLALWKRLQAGEAIRNPAAYLYKMALTTAALVVRRQRLGISLSEFELATIEASDAPPAFGLEPAEVTRLVFELLGGLPFEQRVAVAAYAAGFNHEEVARIYDWTPTTARHRIYRGLKALRRQEGFAHLRPHFGRPAESVVNG